MSGRDFDEIEDENKLLDEVLEFYECDDLLPYARRILWLHNVKEAVGHIPFRLSYDEVIGLVACQEEITKKGTYDSWKANRKSAEIGSKVRAHV